MVVGGAVQIIADRGWYGWSFNIAYFYGKSKKLHSFLNSKRVTRERTFYLQTKIDTVGLIGRLILVGY